MWGSPHPFTILKSNTTAITNPTATDDSSSGYVVGSLWLNTNNTNAYFVATSVTVSAAVWVPVLPVGTIAETVAAGDDPRILGSLQKVANLSDLQSTVTAQTNLGIGGLGLVKCNLTSMVTPTVNNDSSQGYTIGSVWVDNNIPQEYFCNDASVGFAQWIPLLSTGTVAGTVAAGNDFRIINAIQTGSSSAGDLAGTYPNPNVVSTHLTAPLPVAQGGTGSAIQNFVDLTTGQNIGGTKTFTGSVIVPTPSSTGQAATKGYVDGISSGIQTKASVAAATVVALAANTYNNGASGVGATLTALAPGVLTVDGYVPVINDRIMVKNEVAQANNGIYTLTTLGTVVVPYVLTRSTDMDQPAEFVSAGALINNGTVNQSSSWVVIGTPPYVIGTTAVVWTQFASPGLINVGTGLTETGNTISLIVPVSPTNLPPATTIAEGIVQLANDLGGVANAPTVVATHLASPLPILQGGTGSTTASGARTNLGLGTAATKNVNTVDGNIAALGVQSAGATGLVADAGHVHTSNNIVQTTYAGTSVTPETTYGLSTVVGTDTTYAREDHSHGSPSLTGTPPATTEAIGTVAALGVATTPARADHVHPMSSAATPTSSAVGDAASTGAATSFAASNHVHGRESFGVPASATTYGQSAATGTATTVPHSDHTHGTPSLTITAPSTTEAIGTAAALGVATTPALADHVHPMAAAALPTTSAVGDSPATGPATTFSSSNHVHGRESFGAVTALVAFNTSSTNGTATSISHSDHVHGAPALPLATTLATGEIQLAGDLGGTATSPSVLKINGVTVSGTPAFGVGLRGSTATTATWTILPNFLSTGILTGAVMTFNVTNSFNLSAGTAYIADYITTPAAPTVQQVNISAQTVTLSGGALTNVVNYWYADSTGTVQSQTTALTSVQKRQNINLGITWSVTGTGVIYNILSAAIALNQPGPSRDGIAQALGSLNVSGNVVSANGANLNINKASGTMFGPGVGYFQNGANNADQVTSPAETAVTFRYVTQLTNSQSATRTTLDVANIDVGGVITPLAANANAGVHRVWLLPTGVSGAQVIIQYGQLQYSSLAVADTNFLTENYVVNPDIGNKAALIGYIAAVKNATSLNNVAQTLFNFAYRLSIP